MHITFARFPEILFAVVCLVNVQSEEVGESPKMHVYMNKVWPSSNPIETYRYYDFPFCQPWRIQQVEMSFGQVLRGDRLTHSLYQVEFLRNKTNVPVCEKTFTPGELTRLSEAVKRNYLYEMVVGGLPVTMAVGTSSTGRYSLLCTHVKFELGFLPFACGLCRSW